MQKQCHEKSVNAYPISNRMNVVRNTTHIYTLIMLPCQGKMIVIPSLWHNFMNQRKEVL